MTKLTQPATNRLPRLLVLASACFALGCFAFSRQAAVAAQHSQLQAWQALNSPQRAQAIVNAKQTGAKTYSFESATVPMQIGAGGSN